MRRFWGKGLWLALFVLFLSLVTRPAVAGNSFNTLTYYPANDSGYYLTLYGSKPLTQWNWTAGFSVDYSRDPLILIQNGANAGSIVHDLVAGHLYGGVGLTEWMDVGVTVGTALIGDFIDPTTRVENKSFRMGDTRVHMKFRLLDLERYPVGLAFIPYVDIPTGDSNRFFGNGGFAEGGMFAVETKRIQNRFSFVSNVGYMVRNKVTLTGGTVIDDMITYGGGANVMLVPAVDLIAELHGATVASKAFKTTQQSPLEMDAGARAYFGEDRRYRATIAGGGGVISGVGSPTFRVIASFGYTPPFAYREVTLGEPTVREAFEVYELVDKCPVTVEGYVVGRDDPRCTEVYELKTIAEACPEQGAFNPEIDNPKCLQVYVLKEKDSDRDGVPDFRDRCPTEPGDAENEGCPSTAKVRVSMTEGAILTQVIHFDFNKATLREDAFSILDALAATLHAQPAIQKLSVDGHTDKVGSHEANLKLSRDRAKTVYDYLIKEGVNPQRIQFRGFGYDVPVADNRTEEGRAKNRRVEFIIKKVTPGLGKALDFELGSPETAPATLPSAEPESAQLAPETTPAVAPESSPAPELAPATEPETPEKSAPETKPAHKKGWTSPPYKPRR